MKSPPRNDRRTPGCRKRGRAARKCDKASTREHFSPRLRFSVSQRLSLSWQNEALGVAGDAAKICGDSTRILLFAIPCQILQGCADTNILTCASNQFESRSLCWQLKSRDERRAWSSAPSRGDKPARITLRVRFIGH